MGGPWICADLRSEGATVGLGRSGLFRGRLLSSAEAPLPASGGEPGSDPFAALTALAEAVAGFAPSSGGKPEGVLLALPDPWFKIGLAYPKGARGAVRMGEYARWKLQADWNLDGERFVHDWQAVGGRRGDAASILLVAVERAMVDAADRVGEAAGAPVLLCVPRAVAAWNRAASVLPGDGPAAALLRDGNAFTFFGTDGGRLRYLRSRRCDTPREREAEEGETLSHFRETVGEEGATVSPAEWGGGAAVLEGLLAHPLVSGIFS